MKIDSIKDGIVLDHITAGRGMRIYQLLHLEELDCPVAILKNVPSKKMGKKDIIKISDADLHLDFAVIGYVDPEITVNVIREGTCVEKKHVELPEELENVIRCKNPRCITTTEQELPHIFRLADRHDGIYRCIYCDTKASRQL
ncbi:MAG: aspartate carbamoyltransferase regulatory subunit [Clostridia bacterium]|nr:aspartate carbamoyltransferase regulatory subunit [Clostridia bacterium]MBQ4605685.1 aspartate carbamoyltransferase regulatory subunit [Clostridia bacterium]